MQKINNWEKVEATESNGFERMPAGGYVAVLVNVEDNQDREYLKCEFDIIEGEWKQYAKNTFERAGFWPFTMYRSYKSGCEGMFKAFTNAVEQSNANYKWEWDESTLEGLELGVALQTEHYVNNKGDLAERLVVQKVCNAQDVRDGKVKAPKEKWTPEAETLRKAEETLKVEGTGFVVE